MTSHNKLLCIAALAALLAACSGQSNDDPTDTRRGPLGKADTVGSCEASCGGPAADGNCWCDDLCDFFGDCCDDKADQCDGAEACGGFAGLTCSDTDDFCKFDSDQSCGFADQLGTCTDKPEACIEIFAPVCGCDGNTYDNSCFADAAGVNVDHDGKCGPTLPLCLDDDDCGDDSQCDHTECFSNCPEGMLCPQVCWGECKPTPPPPTDSCAGNCGQNAGSCWCDDLCSSYGDCCADKADECDGDDREPVSGFCIKSSNDECSTDADCTSGGCGGELCFNPDIGSGISTCECGAPSTVSGCGCVQGKCTWWN